MGFNNKYLEKLRKIGRNIVLPQNEMKEIMQKYINFSEVRNVLDFGAGTLLWSEYFAERIKQNRGGGESVDSNTTSTPKVIALDSIYEANPPKSSFDNITFASRLEEAEDFDIFFASDVLHHISSELESSILQNLKCKYVIIKDIDANYKLKNLANRLHDIIINGENPRNIYPKALCEKLKDYDIMIFNLHKFCYPHFMLLGIRKENK